jgi:16S rRNA processing protein RimM
MRATNRVRGLVVKASKPPSFPRAAPAAPPPRGERGARVCVAQIGAPHGVRGEVRLKSFTADPVAIADYGLLESEDGGAQFEIASLRPAKDHFVARLRGVDDRDAAARLTNMRLYVPRDRLPPLDEGEFYHTDLIGLPAFDIGGDQIGIVIAVQNFGAGDLLELRVDGGQSVLLPFNDTTVPMVDIAGRRIVINPPDGLFNSAANE